MGGTRWDNVGDSGIGKVVLRCRLYRVGTGFSPR